MKCPHCNTGIHEDFKWVPIADEPQVTPKDGGAIIPVTSWAAAYQRCPECHGSIIYLNRVMGGVRQNRLLGFPSEPISRIVPNDVTDPYRSDFIEACKVLLLSAKASAALSRRLLQAVLRDKAATKKKE